MDKVNKTALVTGGSRGIGRAIAERLARDGFTTIVNYAGNAEAAEQTVQSIVAKGGRATAIQADVASEADVSHLFQQAKAVTGRLDVVVHSAGIMPMAKITPAGLHDFDRVIHTNLRGAFLVLANAAETVSEGGRIIALSTSVIAKSFPAYGPISPQKQAWKGLYTCWQTNCGAEISPLMPLLRAPPGLSSSLTVRAKSRLRPLQNWPRSSASVPQKRSPAQ